MNELENRTESEESKPTLLKSWVDNTEVMFEDKTTPEDVLEEAIGNGLLYWRLGQPFDTPGFIVQQLSPEKRKILKGLSSSHTTPIWWK